MSKRRINKQSEELPTIENEVVGEAEVKAVYVKKSISGFYIGFPEEIDAEYWDGQIGETYEDFLDDKWVLLSDEQVKFHEEYPQCSVKDVLEMNVPEEPKEHELTLEEAKMIVIRKIDRYDNGSDVNQFDIVLSEDKTISAWFTPEERANYRNSVASAKLLGVDELQVFVGNETLTLATDNAERMLAMIQLYADQCFIVTKKHKLNVETLESIEEVENYEYKAGYPDKLVFNLTEV